MIQPPDPIMVEIGRSEPSELEQLGDVLLGALGITGIIVVLSVLVGIAVGGLMFWFRSRSDSSPRLS